MPLGGIAVVGSRTPPERAERFAFELASRLERPIVAGLALGVDTAAHRGALAAGRATVAFVPFGFGRTYPPQNAGLEREIERAGGAIASPLPPGRSPTPRSFVERDRLQAEHCDAIVLVSSEIEGGAMHTMAFARDLGKPRFVLQPPNETTEDPAWAGNLCELARGAQPLPFDAERAARIVRERIDGR